MRVPFGDVNCLKIPDNVPDEEALCEFIRPKNEK
jgi:hypothetical protein